MKEVQCKELVSASASETVSEERKKVSDDVCCCCLLFCVGRRVKWSSLCDNLCLLVQVLGILAAAEVKQGERVKSN